MYNLDIEALKVMGSINALGKLKARAETMMSMSTWKLKDLEKVMQGLEIFQLNQG